MTAAWGGWALRLTARPLTVSASPSVETLMVSPSASAAFQDQPGQRVLQLLLDHPLERTGAIGGVIPLGREPLPSAVIKLQRHAAIGQQGFQTLELDVHDRAHVLLFGRRNRMISSIRFRNSGRNAACTASMT
jgi:hypothetical protein